MRIEELHVDGFGIFRDLHLEHIPPGLVLFCGPNEAGKSTLVAFLKSILFGFPDGRTNERQYPPLAGGQPGGRLVVRTDAGERVSIERTKGRGRVKVIFADGTERTEEPSTLLAPGATRELYGNVYAFGLDELNRVDAFKDDAVRTAIYGAGAGASIATLPRTVASLGQSLERLFKPQGSTPEINRLLGELEEVRGRLREARNEAGEYERVGERMKEIDAAIAAETASLRDMGETRRAAEGRMRAWKEWLALLEHEQRLAGLELVVEEFPEDGVARLDTLLATRRERREHEQRLAAEHASALEEVERLVVDGRLLAVAERVVALAERKGAYASAVAARAEAAQRLDAVDGDLVRALANLGRDWTVERALGVDRSIFTREAINDFERRLGDAKNDAERARETEAMRAEERSRAAAEFDAAEGRLAEVGGSDGAGSVEDPDVAVEKLRACRGELAAIAGELPHLNRQASDVDGLFADALRAIDPEWTAAHIESFDVSVATRSRIDAFERRLAAEREELKSAEYRAQFAKEAAEDAAAAVAEARRRVEAIPAPRFGSREQVEEAKALVRSCRAIAAEREGQRLRIAGVEERIAGLRAEGPPPGPSPLLPAAIAGVGIVAGIGLFVAGRPFEAILVGGVIVGVAAAVFFATRRPAEPAGHAEAQRLEAQLASLRAAEADASKRLAAEWRRLSELGAEPAEVGGAPAPAALDAVERAADEAARTLERREQALETLRSLEAADERARRALAQRAAEAEERLRSRERALAEWRAFALELGLREDADPRTAAITIERVEKALELARQIRELKRRLAQCERVRLEHVRAVERVPGLGSAVEMPLAELVAALDRAVADIERRRQTEQTRAGLVRDADERRLRLEAADAALRDAVSAREAAESAHMEALDAWTSWLEARGFSPILPATAREALQTVETVDRLARERERLQATIERGGAVAAAYEAELGAVCGELGRPAPDPEGVAETVALLAAEAEGAKRTFELRQREEALLHDAERKLRVARETTEACEAEIASLLAAGGASDEETFRRRGRLYRERREALDAMHAAESSLEAITGIADRAALRAAFADVSLDALEEEVRRLGEEIAEKEAACDELRQQRSDAEGERRALASADRVATLRADEERLLQKIREAAAEWSRYAVALHLLEEAKRRFEAEKQPEVIKSAGKYFRTITGDRYTGLIAPIGESVIEVVDAEGRRKESRLLSRGATEQLYLAIRFAFVESTRAGGETLPIIMDDILVNADPRRARAGIEAIAEMARTHQVFYFTCHEQATRMFRDALPSVPVIALEGGALKAHALA